MKEATKNYDSGKKSPLLLDVLVATFGADGLSRFAATSPQRVDGVRWVVACQTGDAPIPEIPASLLRDDIRIEFCGDKGLSRNRNKLLRLAEAPLCLIADDDVSYLPEAFEEIIKTFRDNPDTDIATFRFLESTSPIPSSSLPALLPSYDIRKEGSPSSFNFPKSYPPAPLPLNRSFKGYYIASIEIAFRRVPVLDSGILFNENFGLGSPNPCGEEDLWLHSLLKKGLTGCYFPLTIAVHPGKSTGQRGLTDPDILRTQGYVIAELFPLTAFPRLFLKAFRVSKESGQSPFLMFKHLPHLLSGLISHLK